MREFAASLTDCEPKPIMPFCFLMVLSQSLILCSGASICVLLTDQAAQREFNRAEKPAGYFNAMIERSKSGTLHLHKSIFGILKNEAEN